MLQDRYAYNKYRGLLFIAWKYRRNKLSQIYSHCWVYIEDGAHNVFLQRVLKQSVNATDSTKLYVILALQFRMIQ